MICSSLRTTRFPFDIQHRHVITYKTDSTSDFDKLRADVVDRLRAAVAKESRVQSLAQASLRETEGLEPHEIAALVIIAESDLDPETFPSAHSLKQDMGKAGFTELATVLAVTSLRAKKLVTGTQMQPFNDQPYTGYRLLDAGTEWLLANRTRLALKKAPKAVSAVPDGFEDFAEFADERADDLPI